MRLASFSPLLVAVMLAAFTLAAWAQQPAPSTQPTPGPARGSAPPVKTDPVREPPPAAAQPPAVATQPAPVARPKPPVPVPNGTTAPAPKSDAPAAEAPKPVAPAGPEKPKAEPTKPGPEKKEPAPTDPQKPAPVATTHPPETDAHGSKKAGHGVSLDYMSMVFVFMLATFIGIGVIRRVSRLLHTPLMSLTNAISAIAVVGAIIVAGGKDYPVGIRILGAIAMFASMTNIISGFLITDRMLKMFKTEKKGGAA